jgi:phosphogluconate dehydratase
VRTGDLIRFDARTGTLELRGPDECWLERPPTKAAYDSRFGSGRELFANFRRLVGDAESGALCCIAQRH